MRKFNATISLLFIFFQMNARKMQMVKGYSSPFYKTMEDLYRQKQAELDFYGFKPRQVFASIGTGCGDWEASFAASTETFRKIYAFRKRSSAG